MSCACIGTDYPRSRELSVPREDYRLLGHDFRALGISTDSRTNFTSPDAGHVPSTGPVGRWETKLHRYCISKRPARELKLRANLITLTSPGDTSEG